MQTLNVRIAAADGAQQPAYNPFPIEGLLTGKNGVEIEGNLLKIDSVDTLLSASNMPVPMDRAQVVELEHGYMKIEKDDISLVRQSLRRFGGRLS